MRVCVLDFETTIKNGVHGSEAKDARNNFITTIYGDSPNSIKVMHGTSYRQLPADFLNLLKEVDVIIGHNLAFDLSYVCDKQEMRDFFIRGGKIWDTQVAEYIITAQQHSFSSLAELQEKYLDKKTKEQRISKLYKKGIGADVILQARYRCKRLSALYEKYCFDDGISTLKVFAKQRQRAIDTNVVKAVELYNDYLISIIYMQMSGIHLDMNRCEETLREFKLKQLDFTKQAEDCLVEMWKDPILPKFNVNSPDHKSAVLFGGEVKCVVSECVGQYKNGKDKYKKIEKKVLVKGFSIDKKFTHESKKAGVYATGADIIEKISRQVDNELVKKYCELQKESMMYKKVCTTYLEAFLALSVDSVLYPNFNNTLTVTGRLSSSKPNMQNISKRNKFATALHKIFVAPRGWTCCQIDFGQLEIWVLAWLSGDKKLASDLLNGIDLHCVRLQYYNEDKTYEELYKLAKIDGDKYWKTERDKAKAVGYLMAYGGMPNKVAGLTGLDKEIVEKIYETERTTYVQAANFGDTVRLHANEHSAFSRECDIPAIKKRNVKDGVRTQDGTELLPIFDTAGNVRYTANTFRKIGFWQSPTTKKYHFLETGQFMKYGLRTGLSFTQTKNYPMQGTAADIQGAKDLNI